MYVELDGKTLKQTEVFGKKPELNTSCVHYTPSANISSKEINSWVISGLLIIYILVLVLSKKYFGMLGNILFSIKNKCVTYNEFPRSFLYAANRLSLFSICVITAFFYLLETHIHPSLQISFGLFAIIAAIVFAYIFFKRLCIKIIGYVSENNELKSRLYAIETTILSVYGLFSGFFLTLCFSNRNQGISTWLIIMSVIFVLLYLLKISKLIMIFIGEKISPFFLILYLCALEILPIWLIIDFL